MSRRNVAITITFSESVENNTGMEIIGTKANRGFNLTELLLAQKRFQKIGVDCEIYSLDKVLTKKEIDSETVPGAYVLIARKAINAILSDLNKNENDMTTEELSYDWDTQIFSRKHYSPEKGKTGVVEKRARHNVCYGDTAQEPDIVNKKGTIIPFSDLPIMNHIREALPQFLGKEADHLYAEGNKYYDISKCGIGFHGDTERKKVIGIRLGASIPLHYQWYKRFKPIGKRIEFHLYSGDLYVMSDKAVGYDWKKSSILTLRHAAGDKKYTNPKKEKLTFENVENLKLNITDVIENFCKNPDTSSFSVFNKKIRTLFYTLSQKVIQTGTGNKSLANKVLKLYKNLKGSDNFPKGSKKSPKGSKKSPKTLSEESRTNTETGSNPNVYIFNGFWSPEDTRKYKDYYFIFGDNDMKKGNGGQAVIRDEKNALGIPTKKAPNNNKSSFYTDEEYKENKRKINEAIEIIKEKMEKGHPIVLPKDGLGTGLADLPKRAPKTFKYLQKQLEEWYKNGVPLD